MKESNSQFNWESDEDEVEESSEESYEHSEENQAIKMYNPGTMPGLRENVMGTSNEQINRIPLLQVGGGYSPICENVMGTSNEQINRIPLLQVGGGYSPICENQAIKIYNPETMPGLRENVMGTSNEQINRIPLLQVGGGYSPICDEEMEESNSQFNWESDEDEVEESSEESYEHSEDEDEVALTLQELQDILQPLRDCTEADSRAIKASLLDLMTCYSDVVAMSKILSKAENGTINEEDKDSLDEQFIHNDTVWSILTFVGVQTEKGRVLYESEATPIFIAVAYMIDVILELENDDLENIYYFDEPQLKTLSKIFESAVASSETIISIDENMSSVLKEPVSSFLTRQKFTVCNDSIQPPKPKTCMLEDIFSVLYFLS